MARVDEQPTIDRDEERNTFMRFWFAGLESGLESVDEKTIRARYSRCACDLVGCGLVT
jgi:hypothetical protein